MYIHNIFIFAQTNKELIMKKHLFIAFAVGLCITANTIAQVPGYVPTTGLVGYWPFNGNANDESGNGNNGTVNGATLTTDRFGVANKAYSFDGVDDFIEILHSLSLSFPNSKQTISFWIQIPNAPTPVVLESVMSKYSGSGSSLTGFTMHFTTSQLFYSIKNGLSSNGWGDCFLNTNQLNPFGSFKHVAFSNDNDSLRCYVDGINVNSTDIGNSIFLGGNNNSMFFGKENIMTYAGGLSFFIGKLDDIGIWNRALSDCEIADLYNAQINSVAGSILTSPQSAVVGSTVTLSSSTTSQSVQWQNNPLNNGWQNVPSNATYSGGNTNTLTVTNVQLSNHNQPFRLIANAGNCSDTSNVATIQIADTCITNVTIYDTLLTTVTDTLIINTTLSLPAPNNENTILVYPNPASDHITIDNGNFAAMAGYSIKIENNVGQQVFQSAINQAQFYVDLSTWTGNGLYFVHLIDAQGNTVTVRKIVLQ